MKTFLVLATGCLVALTQAGLSAQTAEARMYCLSVQFSRGTQPPHIYSLDLTGIEAGINGELYPVFGAPRSHYSLLSLNDETWFFSIPGQMLLDVPLDVDENDNGVPDFFEVSQGFNGTSSGAFSFPLENGTVSAAWSRAAGSHTGTCRITLGNLGIFTHTFEIIEYAGTLTYTPAVSAVSGNVDLVRTAYPEDQLQGPVVFIKSSTDPHNELTLQPGAWTNVAQETLSFLADPFYRDSNRPATYKGFVEFDDWNLSTAEADYYLWLLSIDDPNDSNQNGIPDFSDDPHTALPQQPFLSLKVDGAGLLLTIGGEIGQVCVIQETASLTAPDWQTVLSVTVTSELHDVPLPLPLSGTMFWRVLSQ